MYDFVLDLESLDPRFIDSVTIGVMGYLRHPRMRLCGETPDDVIRDFYNMLMMGGEI